MRRMTARTLKERLEEMFGTGNSLSLPRSPPEPILIGLISHSIWLRSNGRFGERLYLPLVSSKSRFKILSRMHLDAFDFGKTKISNVTFSCSNLRMASFAGAELTEVRFEKCDLEGTDFTGAIFNGVNFEECLDYTKAKFEQITYMNVDDPYPKGRVPEPSCT